MPSTFDREVHELLELHNCRYVRTGRHPIWYSPITQRNFPVPTGIKSRHTANEIMKQAGIQKHF
jgi:hypothetical protein